MNEPTKIKLRLIAVLALIGLIVILAFIHAEEVKIPTSLQHASRLTVIGKADVNPSFSGSHYTNKNTSYIDTGQTINEIRVCSQEERSFLVKKMCQKYNYPGNKDGKVSLVVDHSHKVAFHGIAKIGSTTWLAIMSNLSLHGKLKKHQTGFHTNAIKRYKLQRTSYKIKDVKILLKDYTIFVVVRNPFHRVFSGYNNKIVKSKPAGYRNSLRRFLKMDRNSKDVPTFEGFVKMLVANSHLSKDAHFQNYFAGINPCFVNYDYILKLETQKNDLSLLLHEAYKISDTKPHANVHHIALTMPKKPKTASTTTALLEYSKVSKDLIQQLKKKFKFEFEFFGYTFNDKNYIASCGSNSSSSYDVQCC